MKKRKKPSPLPGFHNKPFKPLAGYEPSESPGKPEKKRPESVRNEKAEDAEDLFLRAVSGAKPISRSDEAESKEEKKPLSRQVVEVRNEENMFLQAMKQMGTTLKNVTGEREIESSGPRSVSSRMKQLKRGTIRISEELDLHGHVRDEALARLATFIAGAYSRGSKAVLVITGKGINSPERPVLPGAVGEWLREKGKGIVAEFHAAPRDKGGSGAFVVFLKTR